MAPARLQDPPTVELAPHGPVRQVEAPPTGADTASAGQWIDRWWLPGLIVFAVAVSATMAVSLRASWSPLLAVGSRPWWAVVAVIHAPLVLSTGFLLFGFVERIGYFWRGRVPPRPGRLPDELPTVCVQLPMFDEHAVAFRLIEATCAMRWPRERLTVQVLDDSTDPDARAVAMAACREMRRRGVECVYLHRADRRGYKAGALEEGRQRTDAELLVIFDADFLPQRDFLVRAVPHFYDEAGAPHCDLALVQAQWGHLNSDQSPLTRAQALWVDDHHTLQMSWRSARWRFVNFTGTAGVFKADAVESVGGWRSASLVEDCELSFRLLFAGYRSAFVKDVVVPAELPSTFASYRSQQRRWTRGWAQLQRLHLRRLLIEHRTGSLRRLHLLCHMCISWQWPMWATWSLVFPLAISCGLWLGAANLWLAVAVYVVPSLTFLGLAAVAATVEARHTYPDDSAEARRRRLGRALPHAAISTGMLAHQCSAFMEGLFGPMHGVFERTPKSGGRSPAEGRRSPIPVGHSRRRRSPYAPAEVGHLAYQLVWVALFLRHGLLICALGSAWLAVCTGYVSFPRRAG